LAKPWARLSIARSAPPPTKEGKKTAIRFSGAILFSPATQIDLQIPFQFIKFILVELTQVILQVFIE
jgi:hypothetical protein